MEKTRGQDARTLEVIREAARGRLMLSMAWEAHKTTRRQGTALSMLEDDVQKIVACSPVKVGRQSSRSCS